MGQQLGHVDFRESAEQFRVGDVLGGHPVDLAAVGGVQARAQPVALGLDLAELAPDRSPA